MSGVSDAAGKPARRKGRKPVSASKRCKLQLSVSRVGRFIRKNTTASRLGREASVYTTAGVEALLIRILDAVVAVTQGLKKTRINEKHVQLALNQKGPHDIQRLVRQLGSLHVVGGGFYETATPGLRRKRRPAAGKPAAAPVAEEASGSDPEEKAAEEDDE
jgi:hypothetical protein